MPESNPSQNAPSIKAAILVGICSCFAAHERRKAVRATWLKKSPAGVQCLFFMGGSQIPPDMEEGDLIMLDAPDGYHELPAKVFGFFKYALEHFDFDWLFKCDDDTYVDLHRLTELPDEDYDLIGDVSVAQRGAPSGGAGYFLSRTMVQKIVADYEFPPAGAEDLIVGNAVSKLGGNMLSTGRLYMSNAYYPHQDNDLVTAHWCSPAILKAFDTINHGQYAAVYEGTHQHWKDELFFYANGVFKRKSTSCYGWWHFSAEGILDLKWQAWALDQLVWMGGAFMGANTVLKSKTGHPELHTLANSIGDQPKRIHLACGKRRLASWVNLDGPNYDVTRPLPWKDGELESIYLGQKINLLSPRHTVQFFREAWRTLKPGGVMRLSLTDMDRFFHNITPELRLKLSQKSHHPKTGTTETEALFHTCKYHSLWNTGLLHTLLESLGFEVSDHQEGSSARLHLRGLEQKQESGDLSYESLGTLCIEALKPIHDKAEGY